MSFEGLNFKYYYYHSKNRKDVANHNLLKAGDPFFSFGEFCESRLYEEVIAWEPYANGDEGCHTD